jgi:hypothetical protein
MLSTQDFLVIWLLLFTASLAGSSVSRLLSGDQVIALVKILLDAALQLSKRAAAFLVR